MAEIRLLVAVEDPLVCGLLARWLHGQPDIAVVAATTDGAEAVALARQHRPTVVLTSLRRPHLHGLAVAHQVKQDLPGCAVVILTDHHEDQQLFSAIKAGALGYVLAQAPAEQIVEAVRAAARGEGYIGPALVAKVLAEFARTSRLRESARVVFAGLTRREIQVLELLGEGLRNRDIASQLSLSEKTVKSHVSRILAKLHVNRRGEAAYLAERHGLTEHGQPLPSGFPPHPVPPSGRSPCPRLG